MVWTETHVRIDRNLKGIKAPMLASVNEHAVLNLVQATSVVVCRGVWLNPGAIAIRNPDVLV